jgi:NADH:ubiquinone oxidoreductase subunit C
MFSYELPMNNFNSDGRNLKDLSNLTVYNFHSLYNQDRIFVFVVNDQFGSTDAGIDSINELFSSSNWLEREISELHGLTFVGKKDLRNLMLQYGDTTSPFQKSFPSVGLKEMYFDPIKDTLVQNPVTLQI